MTRHNNLPNHCIKVPRFNQPFLSIDWIHCWLKLHQGVISQTNILIWWSRHIGVCKIVVESSESRWYPEFKWNVHHFPVWCRLKKKDKLVIYLNSVQHSLHHHLQQNNNGSTNQCCSLSFVVYTSSIRSQRNMTGKVFVNEAFLVGQGMALIG